VTVDDDGEGRTHRRRVRRQPPPGTRAEADAERALHGLVGAGPTQVPVRAAMRARDASRPRQDDLDRAERTLPIVRRGYVAPPDGE
jgi:hypothetical protein